MQRPEQLHKHPDETRRSNIFRPVIFSMVAIAGLTASVGEKARQTFNYRQSNLPALKEKAEKIRLPWKHPHTPMYFPELLPGQSDDDPADALDALKVAEPHSTNEHDFLNLASGTSLLGRTMTVEFSIEDTKEVITFRIDQDPETKTLTFCVNGRLFVTAQRIPWLFLARPDDVVDEVTALPGGGALLKSKTIGTAVVSPMEICRALLLLRDTNTPNVTLALEAMVEAKPGTVAETLAKEQESNIMPFTMYLKDVGQRTEPQNLAVTVP